MTCCRNPGEILVVARDRPGTGPAREDPVATDIASTSDDLFFADEELLEPARARYHELTATPFVAVVPEDQVREELGRIRAREDVVAAVPNWGVRLASRLTPHALVRIDQLELLAFLTQSGIVPDHFSERAETRDVRVAVVDSGVDPCVVCCDALDEQQLDTVALGGALATSPHDPVGHGSVVAGLIHLIAPTARIFPIKCFGAGPSALSDIVYGLLLSRLIDDEIDVFNLSFNVDAATQVCSGCGFQEWLADDAAALTRLFDYLGGELSTQPLFVAAAGNANGPVAAPASINGVLAVGAADMTAPDGPCAQWSYTGISDSFVMAPGGTQEHPVCRGWRLGGLRTPAFFGTSFSTAVTTGFVAQILSHSIPTAHNEARLNATLAALRQSAWRGYPAYSSDTDGLGILQQPAMAL